MEKVTLRVATLIWLCSSSFLPVLSYFAAGIPVARKSLALGSTGNDLMGKEGWWPDIKNKLNALPVFTCANEKGQPLQYDMGNGPIACFYCDVNDAKEELAKARTETKLEGLDIIPFPMGDIYETRVQQKCMIIPGQKALTAAGAPEGSNPIGQQVPLFGCMQIMQETEDGRKVLPLFMDFDEAQDAMEMALKMDGGDATNFEVVGLSMERAVEQLASAGEVEEKPAYQFIPPASSLKHIEDTLS